MESELNELNLLREFGESFREWQRLMNNTSYRRMLGKLKLAEDARAGVIDPLTLLSSGCISGACE